jgi:hypothetical protein
LIFSERIENSVLSGPAGLRPRSRHRVQCSIVSCSVRTSRSCDCATLCARSHAESQVFQQAESTALTGYTSRYTVTSVMASNNSAVSRSSTCRKTASVGGLPSPPDEPRTLGTSHALPSNDLIIESLMDFELVAQHRHISGFHQDQKHQQ